MDDSFNFLLFLMTISIISVDDKLMAYQMEELTRGRVIGMIESDRCQVDVTEAVGIDQSMVSFRDCNNTTFQQKTLVGPVEGRPRISTPSDDRFAARRNRIMPAKAIAGELNAAGGLLVSLQTV